jgi:hypothetical protein
MAEQLVKEIVPTVVNKVRDSVRDATKDAVAKQLPSVFRETFETALLPAFEAGTEALFQQVQAAFASGMQQMVRESVRIAAQQQQQQQELSEARSLATNRQLEQEVRPDLRCDSLRSYFMFTLALVNLTVWLPLFVVSVIGMIHESTLLVGW